MADYNLGTARGIIEIEYKGDGAKKAKEDIEGVGSSAKKAGMPVNDIANKAGIAGAVIAGGFALAGKSAADFEQRLSAVAAVSGASASEMEALREKSLQLGKDTAFSASESATAIEELVKAGLSVEDVLNGAADATVNLAAAGEIAMPEAAMIASNAMNQFGLTAEDMVGVVDNIAGAANASAIDVSDFGMSLSQVGAVANLAGVSFEDTAQAIALMGNAGIKGSDAGTSLKSMFQRLQPVTEKQSTLFEELGIITEDGANKFYDAQGNMKSLGEVAGILQKSLKGMSAEQKQATLQTLFGSDAIRAAAILADAGAEGFDNMGEAMNKVSAADVAATRMDNLKGSIEEMMGSIETLAIQVGTILIPFIRDIVDGISTLVDAFLNLPEGVQTAIVAFVGIVGAALLAFAAFVKIMNAVKAFQAAMITLRAIAVPAWLASLGPILLVAAAVAAVIAVVVLLWKKSETFRRIVTAVWDAIKAAAQAVARWFTGSLVPALQSAWDGIQAGLSAVKDFFVSTWNSISDAVETVFAAIGAAVALFMGALQTAISAGVAVVKAVWNAFWGTFGGIVTAAFNVVYQILLLGWTIIKGVFLLIVNGVRAVWTAMWNWVAGFIRPIWNRISGTVRAGAAAVRAIVSNAWQAVRGVTSVVWNAIMGVIRAVWSRISGAVSSGVNRVKSVVSGVWNAVSAVTSRVWGKVTETVSSAVDGMLSVVSNIKGRVTSALSGAGTWLLDAGKKVVQGLIDGIESMLGKAGDAIGKVTSTIGKFLPGSPVKEGPLKVINQGYAGKQIVQMVLDGVVDMQRPLESALNSVFTVPDSGTYTPAVASAPLPADLAGGGWTGGGGTPKPGSSRSRLLEGTLSLDASGRAFIRGIAEDVVDDEAEYQARSGRRNP